MKKGEKKTGKKRETEIGRKKKSAHYLFDFGLFCCGKIVFLKRARRINPTEAQKKRNKRDWAGNKKPQVKNPTFHIQGLTSKASNLKFKV